MGWTDGTPWDVPSLSIRPLGTRVYGWTAETEAYNRGLHGMGASVSACHTSELNGRMIGASTVSSTLVVKMEYCLYICIYGMYVFYIYILPYLCAMQYFHIAHWSMLVSCPAHAHLPARNGLVNVSWAYSLNVEGPMRLRDR